MVMNDILRESRQYYQDYWKRAIATILLHSFSGSLKQKKIRGSDYVYLQKRRHGRIKDSYIGKPDSLRAQSLINDWTVYQSMKIELRKIKSELKSLHSWKNLEIDYKADIKTFIKGFSEAGAVDECLEVVGNWCYSAYQLAYGVEPYPVGTNQVGTIRLPYRVKELNIDGILKQLGFLEQFYENGSFIYTGAGLKIECIPPVKGRGTKKTKDRNFESHLATQSLRTLDLLTDNTVHVTLHGIGKVAFPAPAAFAVHKLIIAQERKEKLSAEMDIIQSFFVIKALMDSGNDGHKALCEIIGQCPKKWTLHMRKTMAMLEIVVPQGERQNAAAVRAVLEIALRSSR